MLFIWLDSTFQLLNSCYPAFSKLCIFYLFINILHPFLQLSLLKVRTKILLFFLLFLILSRKIRWKVRRLDNNIHIWLLILRCHLWMQPGFLKFQIFHQLRNQFFLLIILPPSLTIFLPLKISATFRTLNIYLINHFLNPSQHRRLRYLTS